MGEWVCVLATEEVAREVQELAPGRDLSADVAVASSVDEAIDVLDARPTRMLIVDVRHVGADALRLFSRLGAEGPRPSSSARTTIWTRSGGRSSSVRSGR